MFRGRADFRSGSNSDLRRCLIDVRSSPNSRHAATATTCRFCVESRCDAVALGSNISVSAPFVWRCLTGSTMAPFSHPAHRTRTCRFPASGSRTRLHAFTHGTSRPSAVRRTSLRCPWVREGIIPALSSPDLVLELQPPAQPHRCVAVVCPIRLADGAYFEVVRPFAQRAVHLGHQLCCFLPCPRSVRQCVDFLNHALDALLRWPVTQARLAGSL